MRVRLIGQLLTPLITKSRIFELTGKTFIVSNRPYAEWALPYHRRCRRVLIIKQGENRSPFMQRACIGYIHVDFKTKTRTVALNKIAHLLQWRALGKLTSWGYGRVTWLRAHFYPGPAPGYQRNPRFRILKGLPPNLTHRERQLVMAALLHDLVDCTRHSSKLGRSLRILDPYVQWLCVHHHDAKDYPSNPDLQLLQEADVRTSRYARLIQISTSRRKMAPVNTRQIALRLEHAAQISVHRLYRTVLQAQELNKFTASKAHPTETLRFHLLGVANWLLFWVRTRNHEPLAVSAALTGKPGGTPGPVEMEDRQTPDEP